LASEIIDLETIDRLRGIMRTINKENPSDDDKKELRAILQGDPTLARKIKSMSDANASTLLNMVKIPYDVRRMLEAEALDIKRQMEFDGAPMLEQLLIESLVLCWLRLQLYENVNCQMVEPGYTFQARTFWERRLTSAHSRFLRACEALARVRRLARNDPSLQVNVGVGVKVEQR
jgi:hypothetical protein